MALRDKLVNFVGKIFKKGLISNEVFWALQNVSFSVEKGEVIGVIGSNGAGKSTILKILSRITPPTSGRIAIKGRVASLLEVGTGFHPELSGRENIYVNGSILGMPKIEINKRFDEIVSFAGIEKFLEMPVKHYSSGMYMRLAFSIAANLDSENLLIDEVLAVGDIDFQNKCLGKMEEVVKNQGRTIVFVSHNMSAVLKLCSKCIWLEKGMVIKYGETKAVLEEYLQKFSSGRRTYDYQIDEKKQFRIKRVRVIDSDGNFKAILHPDESFGMEICYELKCDLTKPSHVFIEFYDSFGNLLFSSFDIDSDSRFYKKRFKGEYIATFIFPPHLFNKQIYKIKVGGGVPPAYQNAGGQEFYDIKDDIEISFVSYPSFAMKYFRGTRAGSLLPNIPCQTQKLNNSAGDIL